MRFTATRKQLIQTEVPPAAIRPVGDGVLFVDFGRAVFGTLIVGLKAGHTRDRLVVHLGEKLDAQGRVDRSPPGCIRYRRIEQPVEPGQRRCRIVIPPDERNTGPAAVLMPPEIGEVLPFRYAEIEGAADLDVDAIRQVFVHYPFDDDAASFHCSDPTLNAIWDLCRHTIKATTFCGVYVDGDRERIPYEADAYINQLSHYALDREYGIARYTHEYLIQRPTWPTEWHLQSVMMAWVDYLYTGDRTSIETFYDDLVAKTLIDLAREDGLISTAAEGRSPQVEARVRALIERGVLHARLRDIVDWPPATFGAPASADANAPANPGVPGECDDYDMRPVNTVVNAFHAHALDLMARIASALGRTDEATRFEARARRVADTINRVLFDPARGVYLDGEGSTHASLHGNLFPLAFGLVPEDRRASVLRFIRSRGMACSVYGAQFLLEALYLHGDAQHALDLMTATHDRSWWNMLRVGSTMTLEAWDLRYKTNLDWNHAWGAAPSNIIARFLLGVRPLEPGAGRILIHPQPASLTHATGTIPIAQGPVRVTIANEPGRSFELRVEIPDGVNARVGLPNLKGTDCLLVDGQSTRAQRVGSDLFIDRLGPGVHTLTA